MCAVENFAVGRELFDAHIREAVGAKFGGNVFGRGAKTARAAHAMVARNCFKVALGGLARKLGRERGNDAVG